jgi:phosphotransferase system HPr (HPr) family protein
MKWPKQLDMISKSFTVRNKGGLHTRPSGALSRYFIERALTAQIEYDNHVVDSDSTLDILSLCVPENKDVMIILDRTHATVAESIFDDLAVLFAHAFYMDKP